MKVLYLCDGCGKLHKVEAICLILIKPDLDVKIVGKEDVSPGVWDNLIRQLPEMIKHKCPPKRSA